jgi:Flp pilus assembly protein TadB
MGVLPGVAIVVAPLAGAGGAWAIVRGTANDATSRRTAFRRAAGDFVQLVAIGLTTDQSVEESIGFALDVGTGPGFDELNRELSTAPLRGVAVWEAIDVVGTRYGVRELCEFAASIERQGLQGVAIGDTVAALSAGMRAKALDELEREADRANANLSGPTIGFVVATIVFLAYPLAQRISDAFGG